ncbi:MAG: glycosyltransferase [Deltaproteobacteria bacterium]|nr:glycosyltransferase [Candidatus Zymogenaceae bacterium]
MAKNTVSIVVPVYNAQQYIGAAIQSAVDQTYPDKEIIVVNDGSKDDSEREILLFKEHIHYISQDNAGASAARNRGIQAASGTHIAFLDHDDVWLPHKLEEQMALFDRDPSPGLVFSDFYYLKGSSVYKETQENRFHRGDALVDLLRGNFISLSSIVVRRDVFDEVGYFDKKYKIPQDYDLSLRIAAKYPIDYVDKPLFYYRIYDDSTSLGNVSVLINETLDILDTWEKKAGDPRVSAAIAEHKSQQYLGLSRYYVSAGDKKSAAQALVIAAGYSENRMIRTKKRLLTLFGLRGYRVVNTIWDMMQRKKRRGYIGSLEGCMHDSHV